MSDACTAAPWQPEPSAFHPSLDEFQRITAFDLDSTPPPGGGKVVKGRAYHATCGNLISSKFLDDPTFGEYGCRECDARGFLANPGTTTDRKATGSDRH